MEHFKSFLKAQTSASKLDRDPRLCDVLTFPEVVEVLRAPNNVLVDEDYITLTLNPVFPKLAEDWYLEIRRRVVEKAVALPASEALSLALMLKCTRCNVAGKYEVLLAPHHTCFYDKVPFPKRRTGRWELWEELVTRNTRGEMPWSDKGLFKVAFTPETLPPLHSLLKSRGLDPLTATAKEVFEGVDQRLRFCVPCRKYVSMVLMDWKQCIEHVLQEHEKCETEIEWGFPDGAQLSKAEWLKESFVDSSMARKSYEWACSHDDCRFSFRSFNTLHSKTPTPTIRIDNNTSIDKIRQHCRWHTEREPKEDGHFHLQMPPIYLVLCVSDVRYRHVPLDEFAIEEGHGCRYDFGDPFRQPDKCVAKTKVGERWD